MAKGETDTAKTIIYQRFQRFHGVQLKPFLQYDVRMWARYAFRENTDGHVKYTDRKSHGMV